MEIMAQPILKPGVFWPLPIDVGKILDFVQAAVRSALQEDELPVTELVFIVRNFCGEIFPPTVHAAQGIVRQESDRRQACSNIIYLHGDLRGFFAFHLGPP
jgi:hypothetical protein